MKKGHHRFNSIISLVLVLFTWISVPIYSYA